MSLDSIVLLERTAWWMHIVGIFIFLNYLYYSKHLHILLAFPNTYFANLNAKGGFANNPTVTAEVKLMLDPDADPYAVPEESSDEPDKFGASDVMDLNRVQLIERIHLYRVWAMYERVPGKPDRENALSKKDNDGYPRSTDRGR